MKYFDINTKACKARPHNRLRGPRLYLHDIQVKLPEGLSIGGVQFSFVSTPITPGSIDLGANEERSFKNAEQILLEAIYGTPRGKLYGFDVFESNNVPEGSFYFGPVGKFIDRLRYKLGI